MGTIARNSARKNHHKKKAQYLRNKATRAALYKEHCGSIGWQKGAAMWHATLKSLSEGTT